MKLWFGKWPSVCASFSAQDSMKSKVKVCLGALLYPAATRRWLRFLDADPGLAGLARAHPRLLHKIYRPYLSNRLGCAERVDLLIGHYGLLFEAGIGRALDGAARRPQVLATVPGKTDTLYQLQLSAINDAHREGELCLRLTADGVPLYAVTFVLVSLRGQTYIKIGSLQGGRSEHAAQGVKEATRALHGCRPRNLLVSVVRDIGASFGCAGTLLVSNRSRVAINRRRRRAIRADYDEMWLEMQAVLRPDGDFELPCNGIVPADFASVPSRKRAEAKRRAALLQTSFDTVRRSIEALRGVPVTLPNSLARQPYPAGRTAVLAAR